MGELGLQCQLHVTSRGTALNASLRCSCLQQPCISLRSLEQVACCRNGIALGASSMLLRCIPLTDISCRLQGSSIACPIRRTLQLPTMWLALTGTKQYSICN